MNETARTLRECVIDWLAAFGVDLRAALALPILDKDTEGCSDGQTDPDFERWLHNDPMVTGNPASRYGDDAPGYLTGNGLGSMEIGAADD